MKWKSSRTITISSGIAASALTMADSTVPGTSAPVRSGRMAGSTHPARVRATATCAHSRWGSLSPGSIDTQAAGGWCSEPSHWATRIVFP